MPEELREQVPLMKEMLTAMGIKIVSKAGYEADDLLGTLAVRSEKKEWMLQSCQVIEIFFSWQQKKL